MEKLDLVEIMKIEDIGQRILKLKEGRITTQPDVAGLKADWDPLKHDVMDEIKRKKKKRLISEEVVSPDGKITKPAEYDYVDVNRIPLPLEQDIVNTHVAFTLGTEPVLNCKTETQDQKDGLKLLEKILQKSKAKFLNKKAMRAWMVEQEVAEYWYTVKDRSWWSKILRVLGFDDDVENKFKVALWSPFNGDILYPIFDSFGDMIAFGREYKVKKSATMEVDKFMFIDDGKAYIWYNDGGVWKEELGKEHGFTKIPVIYMDRSEAFCKKIRQIRIRLEELLSNYADCLDYNFAPKLTATGVVEGILNKGTNNEIIELENGAQIAYLTWQQSPEMAKLEFENLTDRAYSLTNTPQLTMEKLRGTGDAFSGTAFRFAFMGAHMAVQIHAETVEEYLQRRINFLISAIPPIYPKSKTILEALDIDVEIIPYIINDKKDDVDLVTSAVDSGVMSQKQGVIFLGLTEDAEAEYKMILEEQEQKAAMSNTKAQVA